MKNQYENIRDNIMSLCGVSEEITDNVMKCSEDIAIAWNNKSIDEVLNDRNKQTN